ncbi:MAG: hypothetical protein R3B45_01595 [Bdellovibrionota bacterium]
MNNSKKNYFRLLPHGPLKEVLPNVFTVTGLMRIYGLFQYSRAMTILNENGTLAIINPVRVEEDLLNKIQKLGQIKYLLKIGQLHNVDVPFYMDKFSLELWINRNDPSVDESYSTRYFDDVDEIPILRCKVRTIRGSEIKESILVTPGDGGCLHSCDAFVNMGSDPNHNWLTSKLSKFLPDPTYIGPNWIKMAKPPEASLKFVLDFDFENFIPAHGEPIIGNAKKKIEKYMESFYAKK